MGKWLNALALSSALASAEPTHALESKSEVVVSQPESAKEEQKLNEALEHTPVNLVVIGDASGSYSMNSREGNLAKFRFLMNQLKPGRDYLQAYMLGMKPFSGKKDEKELGKIGGTGEEQDLVVTAGKRSFSKDTVREVEQKLERSLGQEGRVKGPHSDNLFVLQHIYETIDKTADTQIPVLAFFWDGEPDSPDDVDWNRHPDLRDNYLNMTDRIAAYHELLKAQLQKLREDKGMHVYVFTPPDVVLPKYAKEVTDEVITPEKGDKIEDILSKLRRDNWHKDLNLSLLKLLKLGEGAPGVRRVAKLPEVKEALEELARNPEMVKEGVKKKVVDVTAVKAQDKGKEKSGDKLPEKPSDRAGYLFALGAAITALLAKRLRKNKKQEEVASEVGVVAETHDAVADVVEEVRVADDVGEVQPVENAVVVDEGKVEPATAHVEVHVLEPEPEPPVEPVEAKKVLDDLERAVAALQAGKEMDDFPNLKQAAKGIDIQDREDIQRLYGSLAALMEGIHDTYDKLNPVEQKAVSPFFYWYTDEDYKEFLELMGEVNASDEFTYGVYENYKAPDRDRNPDRYLSRPYAGPRFSHHGLYHNILDRLVPHEKAKYESKFFQPYRGPWFFTHQCAYLGGSRNKSWLGTPRGDHLAVTPTVFREFGLLDDSKEKKTMTHLKWEFADGTTLQDFLDDPMKITDGKIDDNRALGRIEILYGVPVIDKREPTPNDWTSVTKTVCNRYFPDLEHTNFNSPHGRRDLGGFDAEEYPVIEPGDTPPPDGKYRIVFDPTNPAHDFKYLCEMMDGIVETVRNHANIPNYRNYKTRALFRKIDGQEE